MITSQNVIVYIGFCFSILINSFLLYMIRKKTTKQLGTYKYLMQAFSLLELIFSTVDVLNQPTIFVADGTFLLFSTNPLHLPISIARHLNILNFTFSGMIISLLAIHFIYRYFAVCRNQWLSAFDKPYLAIWISVFVLIGLEWYFASFYLGLGGSRCAFDIDNINDNEISDITVFVGVKYTIKNMTTGRESYCWKSISYALILLKIVLISGLIVVFCGWRTYKEMSKKRITSRRTSEMQRQLFRALVFQTLIPTFLLYVPLITLFISPFFEWNLEKIDFIILFLVVLYPILDPMVVLYLVRDYRKAIKAMFDEFIIQKLIKLLKVPPQSNYPQNFNNPQNPYVIRVQRPSNNILY